MARDGSIDWLCVPHFDSPACFAALLGTPEHGRWLIAPQGDVQANQRHYREGTLVLETDFETPEGAVTVIDCMPPRTHDPVVARIVVGKRGRVAMRMELAVRFDYGSIGPWIQRIDRGLHAIAGPDAVVLDTALELKRDGLTATAEFEVVEGQRVPFVLMWHSSTDPIPEPVDAEEVVRQTEAWWREWSGRCTYQGRWREMVLRSLITLKALTFAPSGGIVAAATTSSWQFPPGVFPRRPGEHGLQPVERNGAGGRSAAMLKVHRETAGLPFKDVICLLLVDLGGADKKGE